VKPAVPAVSVAWIDHRDPAIARAIHAVLVPAYAQEAALLQVAHFPPMERSAAEIQAGEGLSLGAFVAQQLVGVLSLDADDEPGQILISALVVHPASQRLGAARALLREAIARAPDAVFAVATAALNEPALQLYRSLDFVEYRRGSIGPEAIALVKLRRRLSAERRAAPKPAEHPLGGWGRFAGTGCPAQPVTTRTGARCCSGSESKRSKPV
jgi:ribosomal protein S18 acetylase RimI-like enzyme